LQNDRMVSPPRLIGYARVSTDDQTPALQLDALRSAGAVEVFEDLGMSGATRQRPGLVAALSALRTGDVLVVWRLDRLGRSLGDLIELVNTLKAKGCGLRSLTEALDTSTAGGELVFHVFGAMAQFERSLGIERTRAGLQAAKQRGAKLGRKRSLTPRQVEHARQLIEQGESPPAVAKTLEVSRSTLWRALSLSAAVLPSSPSKN
jgi:DNA invertase Pin-like site-specific DNA recombinase